MRKFVIENRDITEKDVFVIAEIGCNHGGSVDKCVRMIEKAAECGADAVKLQTRDIYAMFTNAALEKPYENEFSCGATYGEHRKKLDYFGKETLEETREYWEFFIETAEKNNILLFATPFEENSANFLSSLDMPMYKIASCDVNNAPLLRQVAGFGKPIILSTGGRKFFDIYHAVDTISPINSNLAILHCVSVYPNTDTILNLQSIPFLRDMLHPYIVGFSSHHPGIEPLIVAKTLGATIFEVHFTLSRAERGTDHGFSMEPAGLRRLCYDLRRVDRMIGEYTKIVQPEEFGGFVNKMGKSVYVSRTMTKGEKITAEDVCCKSPAVDGALSPAELESVIGKTLIADVSTSAPLMGGELV